MKGDSYMIDKLIFINIEKEKQYNSYDDFGFLIKEFTVDEATVKEELINVPGASSVLDFSKSLTNDINYNPRNLNILLNKSRGNVFLSEYSKIQNALHGQRMKIIHSKEPEFYWIGTIHVGSFNPYVCVSEISIKCVVEPYKCDIYSSDEEWLWDPFNFVNGIINETKEIIVNEELEITIYGKRKKVVPIFICEKQLKVVFQR